MIQPSRFESLSLVALEAWARPPLVIELVMPPGQTNSDPARALRVRDYGRIDMRLTPENEVRILECNPNPDLDPEAGYARSARHHGWDYDELIFRIVESARARWRRDATAFVG